MRLTLRKVVALCFATTLSLPGLFSNINNSNFCFDGDIPEAQSASVLSCITSPVLICPSAYFGCPLDSTHPDITGYATATPGDPYCPDPIVTYSDEVIMNTPCTVKIHRKWHAEYPPGTGNPWLYSECIQIIENIDDVAPVITAMPSDVTVTGNVANCTVSVSWSEPIVNDNCLISSVSSSHTSGFAFPEGVTAVVYTATDNCGNSTTASFNVTVECIYCTSPPLILCPSDKYRCPITGDTSPASTGYATALPGSSICDPPLVSFNDITVSSGPCTGQMTIERTWTATDPGDASLTSSCMQLIHVIDIDAPVITNMPFDAIVTGSGAGCTVFLNWSEPTVVDNCGIQSIVSNYPNGYAFPEGTTTVTYTALDNCGNSATASFTVTVNCQIGCPTPPGISCPYTFITCPDPSNPDPSLSGWATAWPGEPNCNNPVLTYFDQIVSTGPCLDGKVIHRTWKATDPENSAVNNTCVQTIKLEDHIGPTISNCPYNVVVSGTGYNCSVPVSWSIPTVWDNCGVASLKAYDQYGNIVNSGNSFGQGSHTITYIATDHCGNSTNCSFNITVNCLTCITAPSISCPADAWLCIGESTSPQYHGYATATGGAYCPTPVVTYQDWIVSTGPCAGQKVIKRVWTASYQGIGGLSSSCEQLLYVEDLGAPVFYGCPQNITVPYNDNVVYWNPPHVVDGCGNVTITSNYYPGHAFPYGYTTVIYTATDGCGNVSTCSFTIHVTGAPVPLNCPDDIYLDCTVNGGAFANWTPPSFDGCNDCDNGVYIPGFIFMGEYNGHQYYCSLNPASWNTAKQICANNGGYLASINSAGENNFLANQLLAQSAWIGLNDHAWEGTFKWENGDPLIYENWYPGQPNNYNNNQDYVELMTNGKWNDQYNHYSLEFIMELPCSSSNVQQIAGPSPGSFLPEGTHTVIYQVNAACGSNATCSFDIIVSGGLTLECPDDIVLTVQSNSTGATVNWNPPTASSCCSACNGNGAPIPGFVYMGSLDGSHYYCSTSPATWQNAQANCVTNGGNLAVINNETENNFLAGKLTLQSAFIGLSDHVNEGWFEWVNGDPLSYTNWYPNQPNNYGTGQDYVELLHSGQWNDQYNYTSLEYIMEITNCLTVNQIAGPAPGSNLPAGTTHTVTYQAEDGCGNIETCSFDITVLGSTTNPTLCPSGGTYSAEYYIDRFMFADIDNTTGDDGGYADYTNVCTKILENQTYSIVLGAGYGNGWPDKAYWKVWIDYNMDGDFLDPYEFVAYGAGIGTLSGLITTPSHLYQGTTTLRVAMSLDNYPAGPCEIVTYGETEDYCIVIASNKVTGNTEVALRNNETPLNPVDLSSLEYERDIKLYPSPASDFINIEFSDTENLAKMEIFSMNGQLIRSLDDRVIENMVTINVSDLQDGMYYFIASYKDGIRLSEKLIIQH